MEHSRRTSTQNILEYPHLFYTLQCLTFLESSFVSLCVYTFLYICASVHTLYPFFSNLVHHGEVKLTCHTIVNIALSCGTLALADLSQLKTDCRYLPLYRSSIQVLIVQGHLFVSESSTNSVQVI